MVKQVELKSGASRRVCWVPADKKINIGTHITLKDSDDPEQLWEIVSQGPPKDQREINRGWNNNI